LSAVLFRNNWLNNIKINSYLTKMCKYSCEKCAKSFSQKSHYDKDITRKNPCEIQTDKIKALIDKSVEAKLIEINKKLI
jgi:hypothetical protein